MDAALCRVVEEGLREAVLTGREFRSRAVAARVDDKEAAWSVRVSPLDHEDDGRPLFAVFAAPLDCVRASDSPENPLCVKNFYSTIFMNTAAIKVIVDPADWSIVDANPAAEQFYGWSRSELRRMTVQDVSLSPAPVLEKHSILSKTGRRESFEAMHRLADGAVRWVRVFASPVRNADRLLIYCLIQDVTEQRQTRDFMERNKQFLQSFLDATPLMVFVKDLQGRYLFVNQAVEVGIKMPGEEIIGKTDAHLFSTESAQIIVRNDKAVIQGRRPLVFEERARLSGRDRIFLTTKAPMFDAQGNVYAVTGVAADITRLKNTEQRLRQAYGDMERRVNERTAELRQSKETLQKLWRSLIRAQEAERSRIAQEIHDQAGEMITIATIELENLRRATPDAEDAVRLISNNLKELTSALRAICYGLHPVMLDRFGLSAAVEHYVNEIKKGSSFVVRSHIEYMHPKDLPPHVALFLYRALQESLTNIARHAGPCEVFVRLERKGRSLALSVKDTGRGFAPEEQSQGLGLLGMRERAAACGAVLRIISSPNTGADISISFTLNKENPDDSSGNR